MNEQIWHFPPLSLLADSVGTKADRGDINKNATIIEKCLLSFKIDARVKEVNLGPTVTQYALEVELGTSLSDIKTHIDDLAIAVSAPTGNIRIEAPIPDSNLIGIEIINKTVETVPLKTILASSVMQQAKSKLTVAIGLSTTGVPIITDIGRLPHMIIAGSTGTGKSTLINTIISSLLFRASPIEVRLILIDTKRIELTPYNGIPHLLTPVITEIEKVISALKWSAAELERRYKILAENGVRNADAYNDKSDFQALPYIVIIIDDVADLMFNMPDEIESDIIRITQLGRAAGIHLILSTQKPSAKVITTKIKSNIHSRIGFYLPTKLDYSVSLSIPEADKLVGKGDMLFIDTEHLKPMRIQGAYIAEQEIDKLVDFIKNESTSHSQHGNAIEQDTGSSSDNSSDPLLHEAIRFVIAQGYASPASLQRKLSIGYSRAARLMDHLEELNIIGQADGAKPRNVLINDAEKFILTLDQN